MTNTILMEVLYRIRHLLIRFLETDVSKRFIYFYQ